MPSHPNLVTFLPSSAVLHCVARRQVQGDEKKQEGRRIETDCSTVVYQSFDAGFSIISSFLPELYVIFGGLCFLSPLRDLVAVTDILWLRQRGREPHGTASREQARMHACKEAQKCRIGARPSGASSDPTVPLAACVGFLSPEARCVRHWSAERPTCGASFPTDRCPRKKRQQVTHRRQLCAQRLRLIT